MDAPYDAPVQRPRPDPEAMALALAAMRDEESPLERYVRQRWETACAGNRVALDAWREIWPNEARYSLPDQQWEVARRIELLLAETSHLLSTLGPTMLGFLADATAHGDMTAEDVRRHLDDQA